MKPIAVVPVFNEEGQIGRLIDRFPVGACDLVVVDDGSDDGTVRILRERRLTVLRHEVPRSGVGKCLQDGFRYALEHGYDTVVVMAGNGKDDPAEIPRLLDAISRGADYVQGSRFLKGGQWKNLPWRRWAAIKAFTFIWSLCTGWRLTDVTNGFRAYRADFLRRPDVRWEQDWLQSYELEYYLHYRALTGGLKFTEIPVTKNYPTRTNYSKIRPVLDWWRIIKPLIVLRLGLRR